MVNLRLQDPGFKIRDLRKGDLETYQKCFRDFKIGPTFSEAHKFQGTILYPFALMGNMCPLQ